LCAAGPETGRQRRHQSHSALVAWVKRHYRDRLTPGDLAYPALLDEGRRAVDELSRLLRIGNIYPFQAHKNHARRTVRAAGMGVDTARNCWRRRFV